MAIDPRFVSCLFEPDDLVEVRLIPQRSSLFCHAGQLADLEQGLQHSNDKGQHIYIGANPRSRHGGKAADVALARCVFVDIDVISVARGMQQIADASLPTPTCTVSSGHGLHAYWKLSGPMADLKAWTAAQKQLIGMVKSDPKVHDPPRVMRLPGYVNHKEPAALCQVIDADPLRRYDLGQIIPVGGDPQQVTAHWLQKALQRAQRGNRNESGLWLACQLRDAGIGQQHAEQVLQSYADHQDADYTVDEALASVRSAYGRPAREPARSSSRPPAAQVEVDDADPPVIPLEDGDMPEIDPAVLPAWARNHAVELSAAKEVSPTMATLLEVAVMASCVQRAYRVQVEGSYIEPLCVYAAPAMESGDRKTAIHGPVVKPLFFFQTGLRKKAGQQTKQTAVKRRLVEQQIKVLEKQYRDTGSPGERGAIEKQIIELEGQLPPATVMPQVIIEDFTEASLGVALVANGESLLVTSDEGGLFDNLSGRHNDISEIDLFLKAHTGSPHTVNRVGRDNILLERPLLSVAISPQPAILAKLAGKEGFLGRGLIARFLWALPQSKVGHRILRPAKVSEDALAQYHNGIVTLATAGYQHDVDPLMLLLSGQAYRVWKDFEIAIEPRIGPDGDLRPIKPWASKLPGAVARIAGVCHCGTYIGQRADQHPISSKQMELAVQVGWQLIPHAVAAHRLMGGGGFTTTQAVVRHYDASGWPQQAQSLTGWWRPVRCIVGETSRDFEPVAQVLADHAYLIPVEVQQHGQHYRANRRLSESPKVLKDR